MISKNSILKIAFLALIFGLLTVNAAFANSSLNAILSLLLNDQERTETVRPNILLIVADDLGVDNVSGYGEQPNHTAQTPVIDNLASNGVLFRNAWANPQCSPSRASLLTGRHAFRHGVTHPGGAVSTLASSEETIAEILSAAGYQTALFGKWHLGDDPGVYPTDQGFNHFSGTLSAGIADYFAWSKTVITSQGGGPSTVNETDYATEVVAEESIAWINQTSGPWFVEVAFNAPHSPFHVPPSNRHTISLTGNVGARCSRSANNDDREDCYRAATEAMDSYIGDILMQIDTDKLANTLIIFLGDNGTPTTVIIEEAGTPFAQDHGKSTMYEGGVNVPLIISGGNDITIQSGEIQDLVQIQDVFSTITDLTQTTPSSSTIDGQSLAGYIGTSATQSTPRNRLYSELLNTVQNIDRWAHTDGITKYINNEGTEECYNLVTDPGENNSSSGSSATCASLKAARPQ